MERLIILEQLCQLSAALAGTFEAGSYTHDMVIAMHHAFLSIYKKQKQHMEEDAEQDVFTNGGEPASSGTEDTGATMNTAPAE